MKVKWLLLMMYKLYIFSLAMFISFFSTIDSIWKQYMVFIKVVNFILKVDCTEAGKDTCGRFGVTGYPTVKIFKGGELSSDYNGPREYSKL